MGSTKPDARKMIVIGGGVAGLSTACYARMNGWDVEVLEMFSTPGGVCTSWRRGEYLFDHCLHWVLGSNAGSSLYPVFEELGVARAITFHHPERFRRIEAYGKTLTVYTDIAALEDELLGAFPDQARVIRSMTNEVRFYTRFRPPLDSDFGSFGIRDIAAMAPYLPSFLRLSRTTIERYLARFSDDRLHDMLFQMFPVRGLPAIMAVMPLAYFHNHEGGYPLGGSLGFSRAIEARLLELGGTVRCGQRFAEIIVEDDAAVGVRLQNGEKLNADHVVSACDGRSTLYDLLGGRYLTPGLKALYAQPSLWPPLLSISLGVRRDLSNEVELTSFRLEEPVTVAGRPLQWTGFAHYCHDPAFAPQGKSVLKMEIETDYDHWRVLAADRPRYLEAKRKVLETCIGVLEQRLPGIRKDIEVSDVATPITWERYTGNWKGSYEGWLPRVGLFGKVLPRQLPGLRRFSMTGQWTSPGGGVPMCMAQARRLVKGICEREGKTFTAVLPAPGIGNNHHP
jgi:phytoene dehydrogenase-like protein